VRAAGMDRHDDLRADTVHHLVQMVGIGVARAANVAERQAAVGDVGMMTNAPKISTAGPL